MAAQNYLMINTTTNIVENVCLWDGNTSSWQPPQGYLMVVQATTPAYNWEYNQSINDFELVNEMGLATIDYIWDGTSCTTNQPKPEPPTPPLE